MILWQCIEYHHHCQNYSIASSIISIIFSRAFKYINFNLHILFSLCIEEIFSKNNKRKVRKAAILISRFFHVEKEEHQKNIKKLRKL